MGPEGPPGQGEARPLQPGGQLPLEGEQGGALLWEQRPQALLWGEGPRLGEPQRHGGEGQALQHSGGLGDQTVGHLPQKGQGQVQGLLPGIAGAGGEGPQPLLRLAQGSPRRRGKGEGEEQPHSRAAAHAAS